MEEKKPAGTEVLIFKHVREWGPKQDNIHFKKGIIQNSFLTEDLATHGSPVFKNFYTVLGEDGCLYFGTYGEGTIGGSFFRTKEDHQAYLSNEIRILQEKRASIDNQIEKLREMIVELTPKKEQNKDIIQK